jgi:phosphoribosyl 1,2-cyclic phosphate phosphodiesterase
VVKITFLGTGTSYGIPMLACPCAVCTSDSPKNKRLRTSALIDVSPGFRFIIDTTPDFRTQCLRAGVDRLDAILFTHEHSDHLLGLDEVRRYCVLQKQRLPVYGAPKVLEYIRRIFPYAVSNPPPYKGLPELDLHAITGTFQMGGLTVIPFSLPHGSTQTLGFRFDDPQEGPCLAYLTDCKEVDPTTRAALKNVPVLVLDALRKAPHPTHLSLDEALEVVRDIQPGHTYFTHIAHESDHETVNAELPDRVQLAYDGLVLEL